MKTNIYRGLALSLLLSLTTPSFAAAADLFLSPASGSFAPGKTFTVNLVVNSGGGVGINAAEGTVTFDTKILSVTNVTRTGSIFSLWTEEPAASGGTIRFGGGNPSAYKGAAGTVLTITFQGKTAGEGIVGISNASVLAADGKGTNALSKATGGTYTIQEGAAPPPPPPPSGETPPPATSKGPTPDAPKLSSPTHPDENKWYSNKNPKAAWENPTGTTRVAAGLDQKQDTVPQKVFDASTKEFEVRDVADGEWFFHVQLRNENGWGKTAHRKARIDSTPPEPFTVAVSQRDLTDAEPVLQFKASDKLSGIARYEIRVDGGEALTVQVQDLADEGYRLPEQGSGSHSVAVRALDQADNAQEAEAKFIVGAVEKVIEVQGVPWWIFITLLVLLLLVIAGLAYYIWRMQKKMETLTSAKKDKIKKEVATLKEKLKKVFRALKAEVEEKVTLLDKKPKTSDAEKHVIDELKQALDISEELISKDFEDVERELE